MAERRNLLLPDTARWPADTPVIELIDVHKAFGADVVLDGLSLTVETGKTTVVAGQSGSGKSVLLRMMNGLTLPDRGTVKLFGRDLARISERERTALRKRVTMVFQNYALIDSMTVAENIGFPLMQNTRMKRPDIDKLVRELLELLELPHAFDRMPSELSGGMKKRVALARAVITNPEVVLFDEPTTGLDPVMIEFVDNLIIRTQREFAITSVIISHDMASNRRLADTMAVLADGQIVTSGPFRQVMASEHPKVRAFVASAVTERMGRAEGGTPAAEAQAPAWQPAPDPAPPVARVTGLHKRFADNHVLKGIDLTIPEHKITVVIGGSGSGKSVLIKHIIGLLDPTAGVVETLGQDWAKLDGREKQALRGQIGMLFQGAALFDSMTVGENIAFPLTEGQRLRGKQVRERVAEIAEQTSVQGILDRFPAGISNGERKRVGLARALITRPKIMVYDEPTTGQDPIMMQRVDDMIVEASQTFDITSIVISHDMLSTFRIADKIAMIHKGELVAAGTPDELRACPDERVQAFIYAGD
ncbi:MAG: ATP-binding cassette domain-containing protein [Myxococcales bacterium]|nr:ATP-binding cassette domain-containing protein [Myxococcales bacterium]MCB9522780.1 ATP-binding cassette domain-containing protein [Myxococcales bacterium]